ncbi:terminase TerL endonuclease subunit [Bosea sp. (in: a-proteobacteria)]|uniref:terminase large subunit n=1 Tax=Bosea sp. (in: a-proteobacteria) TaxID=1871050 RepID=UPI0025BC28D8|nr:terminase TerL endonuclease subunit [Bosea sp. (in: a-proteobacteria)]
MPLTPSWIDDGSEIPDPFGYGERAVQWLRRLKHPKNPAPGNPFQLDDWQARVVKRIYGPRHTEDVFDKDGLRIARKGDRIVRRVVLLLPRGSRKTSLCAAITLLHTIGPETLPGDLVVSAASAHEQAMELFDEVNLLVGHDKRLRDNMSVVGYKSTIRCKPKKSSYKALAADGGVQHGKTPRVVIADELHVWKGQSGANLWGALDSALVKTPDTLMIVATTAGRGQENLAWNTVSTAIKIQKGEIDDPATLPVIFAAEEGDQWDDPDLWKLVNPGMRHGYPDLPGFMDKVTKAKHSPSELDNFKQFNLNMWADHAQSAFVDMATYDKGAELIDVEALRGRECWLAADLSSSGDLTVVTASFRDGDNTIILPFFFCPQNNLREREAATQAPYVKWAKDGLITATPGNVVDFRAVEQRIRELCDEYDVKEIAFDPALARSILNNLLDDGYRAIEFRQGALSMMPAIAELERSVIAGRFKHGGHPILRMCFANTEVETNSHGHKTRLHKSKKWLSIDGTVAAAMSTYRASLGQSAGSGSFYDNDDWESALSAFA